MAHVDEAEGRAPWTVTDAGVVLVAMAVTLVGSTTILGSGAIAIMPASGQYVARAVVLGTFHALQLGLLTFLAARHGSRLRRAFGLGRLGRGPGAVATTAGLVALLLLATRAFTTLWGVTVRSLGWAPPRTGDITAVFGSGGLGLFVALMIVVVIGPFVEELAFRGVVLRALGERLGMWPSIMVSAVFFAGYHFTAWAFIPLLVLGVAAGWLAWTRRTIWGAVALHSLYNGGVVMAAYWLAR
jgi:membrane protease YdiL (CAAX protease family)